jgi:hypothetical protein
VLQPTTRLIVFRQLNDKNGKKLAMKFLSTNKFAAVIAKIRTHLPGVDNLVIASCLITSRISFHTRAVLFHILRGCAVCSLPRRAAGRLVQGECHAIASPQIGFLNRKLLLIQTFS